MNACHLISNTDIQLKDKLKKLKQEKEDFLIKKCNLLQKFKQKCIKLKILIVILLAKRFMYLELLPFAGG